MANLPTFVTDPQTYARRIQNSDGTTLLDFAIGATEGTKVTDIRCAGDDTSARDLQVGILSGGIWYPLRTIQIPITAGLVSATPPVDVLGAIPGLPVDSNGQKYLFLKSGEKIQVKVIVAVTAAKFLYVTGSGGDFT